MENSVKVTVYRWAGEKWFLRIEGECLECDLTVSQVRTLIARNPSWPIELEIKPWLNHLWESLRHGGWHAPVVLVDGKLLRQGTIPTLAELEAVVRRALESRGIPARPPDALRFGAKECCARGSSPCKSFALERDLSAGAKS
jgi:hypothetical protein